MTASSSVSLCPAPLHDSFLSLQINSTHTNRGLCSCCTETLQSVTASLLALVCSPPPPPFGISFSSSLRNWFLSCFSSLTYRLQLFSHLSFSHFLSLRVRYLYLCLCELSTSSFFSIPLCTYPLLPPTASILQSPCRCIYTCLFPLSLFFFTCLAHHYLLLSSFPGPISSPCSLHVTGLKPHLSLSLWIFFGGFCCNFLVMISLICLFPPAFLLYFSLPVFSLSLSPEVISACRVMVLWLCRHWLKQQLNIDTVEAQHLSQAEGGMDTH